MHSKKAHDYLEHMTLDRGNIEYCFDKGRVNGILLNSIRHVVELSEQEMMENEARRIYMINCSHSEQIHSMIDAFCEQYNQDFFFCKIRKKVDYSCRKTCPAYNSLIERLETNK